jgi:uncharacterized membrane protein YphA (DoxX/SURF4 family)
MSPARSPRAWIGLAVRLAAAGVWIAAGAAKLPDIPGFQLIVEKYGILPATLTAPFARALPFAEIGIGVYLAAGMFVRGTALVGTLLFAAFLAAQAIAWARGIPLECGCFGTAVESSVGPLTMLRDLGLGIPTFLMLAMPARWLSLDARLFGSVDRFMAPSLMRRAPWQVSSNKLPK